MKLIRPVLFALSLAAAAGAIAPAQDAAPAGPPKVIQIFREWVKPGKGGMAHDKSEAAYVATFNKAKLQGHYVALNSMSGKSRAVYITAYPSFDTWEQDNKIFEKSPTLAAEFDRELESDGALLDGVDSGVFIYDEELSFHPHADVSHARYYEITVFHVRLGHTQDWHDLTKMYKAACEKSGSSAHWAAYQIVYGGDDGTYLTISARNSMSEIDKGMAEFPKFMEAMGGPEGMNKLDDLYGKTVSDAHTELLSVNPKQSYVDEAWIKADPDFWKPRKAAPETAAAKPASKAPVPAKPSSR